MPQHPPEPYDGPFQGAHLHEFQTRGDRGALEIRCWRIITLDRAYPWTPELARVPFIIQRLQKDGVLCRVESMWTDELPHQRVKVGGQHQVTCKVGDLGYDKRFLSNHFDVKRLKGRCWIGNVIRVVTIINESETRAINRCYSRWHAIDENPRLDIPLPSYSAFVA